MVEILIYLIYSSWTNHIVGSTNVFIGVITKIDTDGIVDVTIKDVYDNVKQFKIDKDKVDFQLTVGMTIGVKYSEGRWSSRIKIRDVWGIV